ncbi:cytochrome P450 [Peziza echinospora]|nr:cytochrome P450 [Peziza echinospora]
MHALAKIAIASALAAYLRLSHLKPYADEYLPWTGPISTFLLAYLALVTWMVTYWVVLYPWVLSPTRKIPGPKTHSWWNGQFPLIFASQSGELQQKWMDEVPNTGVIRYLGFLNAERIIPTTAKTMHELLHTKSYIFRKPEQLRRNVGQITGIRGMLFTEGDQHRVQRKHMLPAFSYKHLKGLVPKFWEKSCQLVECFEAEIREKKAPQWEANEAAVIDVTEWLSRATLDIIGAAGFGYDFDTLRDNESEIVKAYRSLFVVTTRGQQMYRVVAALMPPWIMSLVTTERKRAASKRVKQVKDLAMRMVREKKRELELGGKPGETDILSLVTVDSPFDEEEMRDQLMTFLAAGHETTAASLTLALHLMSIHPEIQSRLRAEIHANIPSPFTRPHGSPSPSHELLDNLPYLRAVTFEILRLIPPVPMTMRCASENTTLGGYFIPKGTIVMVSPWAINRSKSLWGPTAEEFDPERWITPREKKDEIGGSNYDFMTFLHGPRGCIGKDFARLEFKALLVALLGRFEFGEVLEEDGARRKLQLRRGLTVKPVGGMPLWVKPVPGW